MVGTRAYEWQIAPFAHLFARYWGPETVTWYGDDHAKPLPDNVAFRRIPGWVWYKGFGRGLLRVLEELEGDVFCLFLLDHWISRPVDREGVDTLRGYVEGNRVLRGNLWSDFNICIYQDAEKVGEAGGLEFWTVPANHPHHSLMGGMTFSPALWDRRLLAPLIEPEWDLWECEALGTAKLWHMADAPISVGTRPHLLDMAHVHRHASVGGLHHLQFLRPGDRAEALRLAGRS